MNVYEAVIKRRAIRKYQDKAVSYHILEKCVDAARFAPCGHNHQIFEYIIVDDKRLIEKVFGCTGREEPLDRKPELGQLPGAYIAILINTTMETETGVPRVGHMPGVGMSAENIMLVAEEKGISTCPIMGFRADEAKRILKVPNNYEVVMMVLLGYPAEISVAEEFAGSVVPWVDDHGVHHIPKRKLANIMHRNGFDYG